MIRTSFFWKTTALAGVLALGLVLVLVLVLALVLVAVLCRATL